MTHKNIRYIRPLAKVLFAINGFFFVKTSKRFLEPITIGPLSSFGCFGQKIAPLNH